MLCNIWKMLHIVEVEVVQHLAYFALCIKISFATSVSCCSSTIFHFCNIWQMLQYNYIEDVQHLSVVASPNINIAQHLADVAHFRKKAYATSGRCCNGKILMLCNICRMLYIVEWEVVQHLAHVAKCIKIAYATSARCCNSKILRFCNVWQILQ